MHQLLTNKIKEKIEKIRKEDSVVMPLFTDWHINSKDSSLVKELLTGLRMLASEIEIDGVIDLGDNTGMLGRNEHITNEALSEFLTDLLSRLHDATNQPLYLVNGNHDGIGTDFFKADFWNQLTKHRYGNDKAVYGNDGSYYYVDLEKADTRMIVLSVPSGSDIESEIPHPHWKLGTEQIRWLADTALDTDKNVLLLCHVPLYDYYIGDMEKMLSVWDGEQEKRAYIKDLCGWIEDADEAVKVLNSFHRHEKYENTESGIYLKQSPPSARLIACLSGHTHADSLWQPGESEEPFSNDLLCHQVVIKSVMPYRKEETYGFAFDVMVWTPSDETLSFLRYGDGQDRTIWLS